MSASATTVEPTTSTTTGARAFCGNGVQDDGEECDDGNQVPHDGCEPGCLNTPAGGVFVGSDATCVIREDRMVRCWGNNLYGKLGLGNTEDVGDDELPASAATLDLGGKALHVSIGATHACALIEGNKVRCWGAGADGRLGYGNEANVGDVAPANSVGYVSVGGPVIDVAAGGHHTCALLADGTVRCWGRGDVGRLGYGDSQAVGDDELPESHAPVSLGGEAIRVSAGGGHSCAILKSGEVVCWGYNIHGQLGYGHTEDIGDDELPDEVGAVNLGGPAVQISAGGGHTCAIIEGGDVRCWGDNTYGQLGLGHTTTIGDDEAPSSQPPVSLGGPAVQVEAASTAGYHTCALLVDGAVRCWGRGASGALGQGNTNSIGGSGSPSSSPPIALADLVVSVGVGGTYLGGQSCAYSLGDTVRCWGRGEFGVLGYGNVGGGLCYNGMDYDCSASPVCCIGDAPGEIPPDPVNF
ncbi:MAG: hypothetical protein H6716_28075 [Polyangiaceae bacterium]|nr:hypothetical protein [Polyangiaceae bacterium]